MSGTSSDKKRTNASMVKDDMPLEGPSLSASIKRRIALSRAMLWWERVWPALWPATGIIGLYAFFALLGVLEFLPFLLQWAVLLGTLLLAIYLTWPDRHVFGKPTWQDALRRLERMNKLPHRPLSTYSDKAARGTGSEQLWAAHQQWLTTQLKTLKLRLPSPGLADRDPFALRAALLLCLVTALVIAGPARTPRLAEAFFPGFGERGVAGHLDAWISPPDYTGRAPIFLSQGQREITNVPQGSTLNVQIFGGSTPRIMLNAETITLKTRQKALENAYESTSVIAEDALLSITQGARSLGTWAMTTIPDLPPTVNLLEPVAPTRRQTLSFQYQVSDDYGVVDLHAQMALDPFFVQTDNSIFSLGDSPASRPGFNRRIDERVAEPINADVDLPLPGLRVTNATHTAYKDLTAHPWAGLPVTITLVATDDTGQTGHTQTVSLSLPARQFKEPLAAAIIEQRQRLALSPFNRGSVAGFLNAFTLDADRTLEDKSVYLGLRAAYWRLTRAHHAGDLEGVSELLWNLALHIEDGDLSLSERDLRAAREALTQALAEGASAEEIEQLMQELKTALARYMDELSNRQRVQADQPMPNPDNNQTMERSDLEKMLDAIGDLARTGARDQAQELLSQLDDILENLDTPRGESAQSEGEKSLSDAINKMSDMINQQRSLMDETFQHGQGAQAGSDSGEARNQPAPSAPSLDSLRQQQEALRQQLQELMGELGENGQPVPGGLENAVKAMEKAEDRLAKGRSHSATGAQGQAIDQLREGTQALADAMFEAMSANGDRPGQPSSGSQTDPLGRPTGSGSSNSQATKLPEGGDLQRARQILEELRKRAADLDRPQEELDYLERLLRRF